MKRTAIVAAVGMVLTAGIVGVLASVPTSGEEGVVRYDRESRYYRIRVLDYPALGRRCLHFSKSRGIQSSMMLADPTGLDLRYSRTMMAALGLKPEARDVLLVGLGGASIPKFIQARFPDIRLDVVEIDPDVVRVCQEYFEFRGTPNTRVIVMDGRVYLKRCAKAYDIILLDAYAADHVPFHLTTLEFLELVRGRLKAGGLAVSNLWEQQINRFYLAELRTFQETFPQTYLLKAGTSGNVVVFGDMKPQPTPRDAWTRLAARLEEGRDFGFDLSALVAEEYSYLTGRRIVERPLTDDMAPVNTMRHEHPAHFEPPAGER